MNKPIKIKGWFAKNAKGVFSEALFFYSKPKKFEGRYRHNKGHNQIVKLKSYGLVQSVVKAGECKPVEMIIREIEK